MAATCWVFCVVCGAGRVYFSAGKIRLFADTVARDHGFADDGRFYFCAPAASGGAAVLLAV